MPSEPKLFQPIQVGDVTLAHRVVLAPLTRLRANREHVHGKLAVEYYTQRASIPGTLLISEATFITGQAGGFHHVPGIWSDAQIAAWKSVRSFQSKIPYIECGGGHGVRDAIFFRTSFNL